MTSHLHYRIPLLSFTGEFWSLNILVISSVAFHLLYSFPTKWCSGWCLKMTFKYFDSIEVSPLLYDIWTAVSSYFSTYSTHNCHLIQCFHFKYYFSFSTLCVMTVHLWWYPFLDILFLIIPSFCLCVMFYLIGLISLHHSLRSRWVCQLLMKYLNHPLAEKLKDSRI